MQRNDDHAQAQQEADARQELLKLGELDRRPWQPAPIPPSAVDLIQLFLASNTTSREAAIAALQLLPAARAEVDQLETGVMFAARGLGITWAEMARALGLNSPQACQQRLDRLTARQDQP